MSASVEPGAAAPPRPGERDLPFTAFAFVLGLLPRLYVAIAWPREPVWDGHYYDFGARRIAAGLGYSDDAVIDGLKVWHPWCHYPVGYSGFLGMIYRVFGAGPHVATVANAIVGALLVAVVHRLARYALTPGRARAAALLTALSPGLVVYSALLMTEPLAAFGIMAAAWLFVRGSARQASFAARFDRSRALAVVSAGVALGLTALVRPQSLLCAPALALLALPRGAGWSWRPIAKAAGAAAAALAVALLVVLPWTARNCRVMDGCALVSTNAGWNLAIGASPRATGRFEGLKATDGCPVVTGQVQQDRCWMHEGMKWIREDTARWAALIPKKLAFTFDHESFPVGYLGEADRAGWPEERKAYWRDLLSGAHRALLGAAALGVVAWPFRRRAAAEKKRLPEVRWVELALAAVAIVMAQRALFDDFHPTWGLAIFLPLAAALPRRSAPWNGGVVGYLSFAVASVVLTHAVFFGEDRYHMVVTPALCLLAAAALRRPDEQGEALPAR